MPRSSRSKSHKQSKHSSKEHSDIDEDVKMKERNDNIDGKENGVSVKVSKDSFVSGEKRKLGKDLSSSHANGNVSEEYATPTKRRKERTHGGDRSSGDGGEEKSEVVNVDDKKLKSKDSLKVVGESKSKSSRKHDVDSIVDVVSVTKEESKSGSANRGEKRSDKESSVRKEGRLFKENKEPQDQDRPSKRGREHSEWAIEDELRNIELEKELEKRMRRRGESYNDKDKYRDVIKSSKYKDDGYVDKYKEDKYRESSERVSKSRDSKYRAESEKDSKNKDDKYREEGNKDNRHKDEKYRHKEDKYREDVEREHRHRNGKARDDISHRENNNRGGSPICEDRVVRHKDDKDRIKSIDKDEITDYKSRSVKEQYSESEKRSVSAVKVDVISEKGRVSSRDDVEITVNPSRRKSSPSGRYHSSRDHDRVSKQEETKYRDYTHEERSHRNANSNKDFTCSPGKTTQNYDNHIDDLSGERRLKSDTRSSTVANMSPSSTTNERRHINRHEIKRNLDVEESGQKNYSDNKSFIPPQPLYRTGSDSPLGFIPSEDDRNKSNNLRNSYRRTPNNWNNNIPNWHSPLSNGGYMPFVHPPMFNPIMQQFGPPIFARPPMFSSPLAWRNPVEESILPPLHNWEVNNNNNSVFGTTQLNNNHMWESTAHRPADEVWSEQVDQDVEIEESQPIIEAETIASVPEVTKVIDSPHVSVVEEEDGTIISRVYLSKIDVSEELTQPELYDQCASMLDLDQEADEFDCKILFLEEGIDANITSGASLFAAIDDSLFKKAMSLYTKQKVHFDEANEKKNGPEDDVEEALEVNTENNEPLIEKLNSDGMDCDEQIISSDKIYMEVDVPVVKQEKESYAPSVGGFDVKDSLLTNESTSVLIELGSGNSSMIHDDPESTH